MALTEWTLPAPDAIPARVNDFLESLPGPVTFTIPGRDTSRNRVLITLSHGNEPSGLEALHAWLRTGDTPAVNIVVILGSVVAAQTEPLFFFRQLPGQRDLNRCFRPPFNDEPGRLALAIMNHIRSVAPEAIVDMHNTSGTSAGFAVTTIDAPAHSSLIGHFVSRVMLTDLNLGSVMEVDFGCPIVTIETGGSQDDEAGRVARQGLRAYFMSEDLYGTAPELEFFRHPLRLELKQHSRIDYADKALHDRDVTIRSDVEHLNFGTLAPDDPLGWLDPGGLDHLDIGSERHDHPVTDFFCERDGCLYSRVPLRLFMATTRADIAASDCLFYFVTADPRDWE